MQRNTQLVQAFGEVLLSFSCEHLFYLYKMRGFVFAACLAMSVIAISGFRTSPEMLTTGQLSPFLPKTSLDISEYEKMTTTQIIESFGYKTETHHVVTEDGYILELHRIPYGIKGPSEGKRPIAFLQHCLLCSSSDWVMDKPDRALAYLLADAGYDVWLNNFRGNTYSRNHTTLDPEKKKFWQFSWDEMGYYDIPAAIDYALEITGNTVVYYVGFSMGTTTFFALMSDRPEYADKIKVSALLAPVTYVEHLKGPLRILGNYSDSLDLLFSLTGHYEILASGPKMDFLAQNFCEEDDRLSPICSTLLFLIAGFDRPEMNQEYLPIVLSHTPAGTSIHTVTHYTQLIYKDVFQKYDWGSRGNEQHYGQKEPPAYNLEVDTPPIGLFWGPNDWLADPQDVARLASELKNVVLNHRVEHDKWNHLDFVWAIHAKEYVYNYVLDFLAQY